MPIWLIGGIMLCQGRGKRFPCACRVCKALILGIVAWSRDRSAGGEKRVNPARAAIFLGALVLVTNWVGFSLILLGLGLDR